MYVISLKHRSFKVCKRFHLGLGSTHKKDSFLCFTEFFSSLLHLRQSVQRSISHTTHMSVYFSANQSSPFHPTSLSCNSSSFLLRLTTTTTLKRL